ncbi:diphthamide biosynthesis protein [Ascodesmis nigricans]|uniref:2-(3-amino-3-carboxypropyl)histidine synthase subunit 2 n=1 Tax=Ascodesmis nigricans TaxID=341454 RepID=A0A4S2MT61_9PEZI|nr:diphthamide biosynthesis protein [Ascodesmis nigricans]
MHHQPIEGQSKLLATPLPRHHEHCTASNKGLHGHRYNKMISPDGPPAAAPVLSTDSSDLFSPAAAAPPPQISHKHLSDEAFSDIYEIARTVKELNSAPYRRIALQFPDSLLTDSSRVYGLLDAALNPSNTTTDETKRHLFILADTSFAACCVDEIAAQHASADVLVHYGRACLSPTTRLSVIYVFTSQPLDIPSTITAFTSRYPDKNEKIILTADVTYHSHLSTLTTTLREAPYNYTNLFTTSIQHNPAAPIPNRTSPSKTELKDYQLFHIPEPLPALQLLLPSRLAAVDYVDVSNPTTYRVSSISTTSSRLLRRRYGLLSQARSAGIIGILVNTLNVKHYLPLVALLTKQIREAGRKSYTVVVGKVNVEKVANFAEVEVWVGVGCWEQGVVGGVEGREWFRPVITPWELQVALGGREWGDEGGWVADFGVLLKEEEKEKEKAEKPVETTSSTNDTSDAQDRGNNDDKISDNEDSDSESEPPVYDFRLGRYVSTSTPLRAHTKSSTAKPSSNPTASETPSSSTTALTTTARSSELAKTGGVFSPAARFLHEKRTWTGLGSDYAAEGAEEEGAVVEEGRKGIARGYEIGGEGEVGLAGRGEGR